MKFAHALKHVYARVLQTYAADEVTLACDRPLLSDQALAHWIEQAQALRHTRAHGREIFLRHPGDARSAHLGRGLDFEEVRAYQAGDDIRDMDWRTTARAGKPYLKVYREEHHPAMHLVVDRGASMRWGTRSQLKVTQAARVAILAAVLESSSQACVGATLMQPSPIMLACLPQPRGILQLAQAAVAACPPLHAQENEKPQWQASLNRIAATLPAGSRLLIVSDLRWLDETALALLGHLAERHDVAAIHISDPAEGELPLLGRVDFFDLNRGQMRVVDTRDRLQRSTFSANATARQERLQGLCARAGIAYFALATTDDAMQWFSHLAHA